MEDYISFRAHKTRCVAVVFGRDGLGLQYPIDTSLRHIELFIDACGYERKTVWYVVLFASIAAFTFGVLFKATHTHTHTGRDMLKTNKPVLNARFHRSVIVFIFFPNTGRACKNMIFCSDSLSYACNAIVRTIRAFLLLLCCLLLSLGIYADHM